MTNNGRENVSGLEAGAAWQDSIDGGTNWTTGSGASFTLAVAGKRSSQTGPLADDNYILALMVTDAACNLTDTSAAAAPLDTTASAPSLSLATDSGSSNSDTENTVVGGAGADVLTGGSGAD